MANKKGGLKTGLRLPLTSKRQYRLSVATVFLCPLKAAKPKHTQLRGQKRVWTFCINRVMPKRKIQKSNIPPMFIEECSHFHHPIDSQNKLGDALHIWV